MFFNRGAHSHQVRGIKAKTDVGKHEETPEKEGDNFLDDDEDLQNVKNLLELKPKSKSPPLARANAKRIIND